MTKGKEAPVRDLTDLLKLKHGSVYSIPCRGCLGLGYISGTKEIIERCPICAGRGRVELVKTKQT